jgi:hypothetical protein
MQFLHHIAGAACHQLQLLLLLLVLLLLPICAAA